MSDIDIADDDALRFIQRVLESNAPQQDRERARNMVVAIRTRVRKEHASPGHSEGGDTQRVPPSEGSQR